MPTAVQTTLQRHLFRQELPIQQRWVILSFFLWPSNARPYPKALLRSPSSTDFMLDGVPVRVYSTSVLILTDYSASYNKSGVTSGIIFKRVLG